MLEKYDIQLPDGHVLSVELLANPIYFSITFPGGGTSVEFKLYQGQSPHVNFRGDEVRTPVAEVPKRYSVHAAAGGPSIQFNDPEPKGTQKESSIMPQDTFDAIPLPGGLSLKVGVSEPRALFSIVPPPGPLRILHFARAGHPV